MSEDRKLPNKKALKELHKIVNESLKRSISKSLVNSLDIDHFHETLREALKGFTTDLSPETNPSFSRKLFKASLKSQGLNLRDDDTIVAKSTGEVVAVFKDAIYDSDKGILSATVRSLKPLKFIEVNITIGEENHK